MDRTQVVLSAGAIRRQEEFTRRIAALHRQRAHPPLAMVDTYGCPNVRV